MALALGFSRARGLLCVACIVTVGLFIVTGGCPGANTGDPNDPNNAGQVGDPNAAGTGGNDPNATGGGGNDPNATGGGGNDPNATGGGGGNDPNATGGGGNPPPAPTSITLTALAKTGDAVPGQATGVTFTTFANPVIDSKGRVAFWALFQGSGARGSAGLYIWDGTALDKVVDNDPNSAGVLPGRSAPSYFDYDPNQPDLSWGAGDRLLFCALIQPESVNSGASVTGLYRWRASDGNVARVTDRDQVAATFPDVANVSLFSAVFSSPGISDAGFASFVATYQYIRDPNSPLGANPFVGFGGTAVRGLFSSNGTTVTKIADATSQEAGVVPDQPADAYFTSVAALATVNPAGDVLFQSGFTSSTVSGRGVYLEHAGTVYRVIDNRTAASWPGLAVGAQVLPRSPALGYALAISAGQIAVAGKLTVSGTSNPTVLLWDWNAGAWTVLYGPGSTPASALLTGVNDDGQVVILAGSSPYLTSRTSQTRLDATLPTQLQGATVTWADNGGSINNNGRAVLPYTNNSKPGLALWTGAELLVIADAQLGTPPDSADLHTISGPERDRSGRSGLLNDADQSAFRTVLADSTEAIYLAEGN